MSEKSYIGDSYQLKERVAEKIFSDLATQLEEVKERISKLESTNESNNSAVRKAILQKHQQEIGDLNEKLYGLESLAVKIKLRHDNVEKEISKFTNDLKKIEEIYSKLEKNHIANEAKLSLMKQFSKLWPLAVLIPFVIDYNKIIHAAKSFVHLI